jgi:hypothetical protein
VIRVVKFDKQRQTHETRDNTNYYNTNVTTLLEGGDMEIDAETPEPHSYTILRIKRKRNEEPLDALGRPALQPITFSDHRQIVLIHTSH